MYSVDHRSGETDESVTVVNDLTGYNQRQLDFLSELGVKLYATVSDARIEASRYGKPVIVRSATVASSV